MSDIYSVMFERVIKSGYAPGERLKEQELAREFGISRTPVRDALRELAEDGLVEIMPKQGARVVGFDADDVEVIYDIRLSLELLALGYAGRLLSLERLRELRAAVLKAGAGGDHIEHEKTDARLHNYIIEVSGKRRIISMLARMFRLIQHFRELGFRDQEVCSLATKEHLELIDALIIRDIEEARAVLRKHLEHSKSKAISHLVHEKHRW